MRRAEHHDWQLRFRPLADEPGGPDHVQRMRQLLKAALRTYRFRCEGLMIPSKLPPVPPDLNPEKSEPEF